MGSLIKGDSNLQNVYIQGEISNFKIQRPSNHMYFALKDKDSVISAVMFSYAGEYLRFVPRDGMSVIARGNITLYQKTGKYQIQVLEMMEKGEGSLSEEFEKLKKRLDSLGYFSPDHKKEIPSFPEKIGIITSPTGAAVRDIFNVLKRRYPSINVMFVPSQVQGESAEHELADAVGRLSESDCDVIIIARGGGSIEDLWAFNSELLAKAIYECKVPVISGVGHETDFTICDFVSDLRAPTPSAAAEIAVPDKNDLLKMLDGSIKRLNRLFESKIQGRSQTLDNYMKVITAYSPAERIRSMREKLVSDENLLSAYSPLVSIRKYDDDLKNKKSVIDGIIRSKIDLYAGNLDSYINTLESVNPVSVLKRGYSYTSKDGKNVSSVSDVSPGDRIDILLKDGSVSATVDHCDDRIG